MTTSYRLVFWLALVALVGCGPTAPRTERDGREAPGQPAASKTITIGQLNVIKTFSSEGFSNTSGGGASLAELHVQGLVTNDRQGGIEPRLVTRLPSMDDGSIALLPDGRMRTTWKLRPNVKWHDGAPFTADDVILSWRVATDPDVPLAGSAEVVNALIQRIEAPDPLTVVMTWKTTFFRAIELGHREVWLLPSHLLGAAFEGDKEAFVNHPYFSTEYVHLGPFRLVDFGLGERMVFERFDDYFLGRPRIDRIIVLAIPDTNTLLANLRAESIDILAEKTLSSDVFVQLRDDWRQSGAGTLYERQDNWRYIWFQFDPQWARPIEMSQDVRLRRGLVFGLDREALREFLLPGFSDSSGDTFMLKNDPKATAVGQPFARYPYDPARAAQQLADGGWRRAPDGRLLNRSGEPVEVEVRGSQTDQKEVTLIADNWRRLGIDVKETIPGAALARDNEYKSKFPGVETRARGASDQIFTSFDGRLHAGPQNRWNGANNGHYANPALDRLIDRLHSTLDEREQGLVTREMGELMATELPALPLYFRTTFAAVVKGVRALADDYAGTRGPASGPGVMARNAHLWDRD